MKIAAPSRRTSSCITAVSAPGGMGAPVKTRIASPPAKPLEAACPAAMRPTSRKAVSAPGVKSV
jgi:hypothetical protein